jgi:hypothetical protein
VDQKEALLFGQPRGDEAYGRILLTAGVIVDLRSISSTFKTNTFSAGILSPKNGTMSAVIFKCKMALAIQLKLIFLALKWALSCLKNCVQFFQESNSCK